jgi:hypothetical protein
VPRVSHQRRDHAVGHGNAADVQVVEARHSAGEIRFPGLR